jgi:hypothetical protein
MKAGQGKDVLSSQEEDAPQVFLVFDIFCS